MPCTISSGRAVDCKDQIGGIKTLFFMNYANLVPDINTGADGTVTDIGTQTVYQYDVRPELCGLNISVNSSKENGTTFYEQSLEMTLHKLTAADEDNLRLLTYGRPVIFVLDNNNQVFIIGASNGCDASGTIQTGQGFGDMSGYQFTFVGKEPRAYYQFPAASTADPFGDLTGVVTIVT